jgi:acyl-CoA thioester hydrolase
MVWERALQLRYGDLDYLGHVTAAAYLMLFEEARARWMAETLEVRFPVYVVANQRIGYLREVLLEDSPITISVTPVALGASSVEIAETLVTAAGELKARSEATLVMWDAERRGSRPLTGAERAALDRQVKGERAPGSPADQ